MRRTAIALLFASRLAHADVDAAREHYQRGEALYNATRYDAALREFEEAQALEPLPALVYDIAKCLDRLDRRQEALEAYERYLVEAPGAENKGEVQARMEALRVPLVLTVAAVPRPPRHRLWLAPSIVGGVALAFAVTGAGLLGSAARDYGALDASCAPTCATSSWANLPAREHAGEALLGVAAVVAVVDVALIVRAARRGR